MTCRSFGSRTPWFVDPQISDTMVCRSSARMLGAFCLALGLVSLRLHRPLPGRTRQSSPRSANQQLRGLSLDQLIKWHGYTGKPFLCCCFFLTTRVWATDLRHGAAAVVSPLCQTAGLPCSTARLTVSTTHFPCRPVTPTHNWVNTSHPHTAGSVHHTQHTTGSINYGQLTTWSINHTQHTTALLHHTQHTTGSMHHSQRITGLLHHTQHRTESIHHTQHTTGSIHNTQHTTGSINHTQHPTGLLHHIQHTTGLLHHIQHNRVIASTQHKTGSPHYTQHTTGSIHHTQHTTGSLHHNKHTTRSLIIPNT